MDALKAEIALKRKTLEVPTVEGRPNKYMRRGDIERLKEEQERKAKEEKEAQEREERGRKEAERLAKLAKGTEKVSNTLG
jgi:pre-mRNA-splicing factor 18